MAMCQLCGREMTDLAVTSCSSTGVVFPSGDELPAIAHKGERCHDCNVTEGGYHHPNCDIERCPRCGGQLISCGCLDEKEY